MNFSSIGDLASSFLLNRNGHSVRKDIDTLSKELVTGLKENTVSAIRGDYANVADWESRIARAEVREKTLAENIARANAKLATLSATSDDMLELANNIDVVQASSLDVSIKHLSDAANGALTDFVSRMNGRVAGQSLFAGTLVDSPAFAPAEDIIASAKTALTGAVTLSDVHAQLDAWLIDPIAGYPIDAYLGNGTDAENIRLGVSSKTSIPGNGEDDAIVQTLKSLVLATLANDPDLGFSSQERSLILGGVATDLRNAHGGLVELQASIGYSLNRMETAKTMTSTEKNSAREMRLASLSADPYETATRLQNAEIQLEKIYTLTARSARMSLLEFL